MAPHWNWHVPGVGAPPHDASSHLAPCAGVCDPLAGAVDVRAYANGAAAELFVNNKSMGVVQVPRFGFATWDHVPYEPGTVRVVVSNGRGPPSVASVETTGPPVALRASFKDDFRAQGLLAGCGDVVLVRVDVIDASGRIVPTADDVVTMTATDDVLFLGGGNGDPSDHTRDTSTSRPAYHGSLLGIFQSTDAVGVATVSATAAGLAPATLRVPIGPPPAAPSWWCPRYPGLSETAFAGRPGDSSHLEP